MEPTFQAERHRERRAHGFRALPGSIYFWHKTAVDSAQAVGHNCTLNYCTLLSISRHRATQYLARRGDNPKQLKHEFAKIAEGKANCGDLLCGLCVLLSPVHRRHRFRRFFAPFFIRLLTVIHRFSPFLPFSKNRSAVTPLRGLVVIMANRPGAHAPGYFLPPLRGYDCHDCLPALLTLLNAIA
jgi:hypothetical protein